jgi:uncharacterized lipoprotein YddW (UPF0748 family)
MLLRSLSLALATACLAATWFGTSLGARDEVRALWIVRDSLASPPSIDNVVREAVAGGFNTLLVQVRGRGDAMFLGGPEPRSHLLATQTASFDPLAATLAAAHAAGLKVHAWINVNLVASATLLPAAREHVANRHPEWLMVPRVLAQELGQQSAQGPGYLGRLARWTRAQEQTVEGLFLSPIVPAASAYTARVVEDLVARYPLDGVHLDYIRYPGRDFDHSRLALAEFAAAMSSEVASPVRREIAGRAQDDVLAWVDAFPERWEGFRRSRLTALLMRLRTAIRNTRPTLPVSAAVFPDPQEASASRYQDWRLWAESGLLDVVCPMAYTPEIGTFRQQVDEAVRVSSPVPVWAGIGAYRLSPAQAVAHIAAARALGARGVVLFSYDTMVARSAEAYLATIRRAAFAAPQAGQLEDR